MNRDALLSAARDHHRAGRIEAAAALYAQLLIADANDPDALHLSGLIAHQRGQHLDALDLIHRAIARCDNDASFHNNLGNVLRAIGDRSAAIAAFERAISIQPQYFEALNNLGLSRLETGDARGALAACETALALRPNDPKALNRLGSALVALSRHPEAVVAFDAAVRGRPEYQPAWLNMGNAQRELGMIDEAIVSYRRAIDLGRQNASLARGATSAHSNALLTMHYRQRDPQALFDEHRDWAVRDAEPITRQSARPITRDIGARDRLRVGYVSPYFRAHAVAVFLEPLIVSHDRSAVDVFCYSDVPIGHHDEATTRMRAGPAVVGWRDTGAMDDAQLAELVREDRIDVLIDVTGHIAGSRLLAFARRPAPVQVTYLGYQNTTGMSAMNWRLTDGIADPIEARGERYYSEHLHRLPRSFFAYRPWDVAAPFELEPPALRNVEGKRITFGSFNSFAKVSPQAVAMWAAILRAVPESRLIVQTKSADVSNAPAKLWFDREEIDPSRIIWTPGVSLPAYLQQLSKIDMALDTTPFSGHTTTCDALWMGAPVITLAKPAAAYVSRMSASVLINANLPELVATREADYVSIAAALANDVARLRDLRATMRERLLASRVCDGRALARDIEAAYRAMCEDVQR